MGTPPRWFTEFGDQHAARYIERFRRLADEGADLAGEARLLDALVAPASRVVDAGCGAGRVAAELHRRGHRVLGVDVDPDLVAAAVADYPGPDWLVADLAELDLGDERFDAAVIAGNVLVFVAPDTERRVLERVAAHVRPDGPVVVGFATDRHYPLARFDADCAAAGLDIESRFATWDVRPWRADADFAVTVLRVPG